MYAQWRVNAARRARRASTVLLDGQGGDELFGGYPPAAGFALRCGRARRRARAQLAGAPAARRRRRAVAARGAPAAGRCAAPTAAARPRRTRAGVTPPRPAPATRRRARWARGARPAAPRAAAPRRSTRACPQLLRYADRSSMAHSREVRLPFLDRRIAEFALSLPAEFVLPRRRDEGDPARRGARASSPTPSSPGATRSASSRRRRAGWPSRRSARASPRCCSTAARASAGCYDTAAIEADARAGQWRDSGAIWRR